jgi:patatin-like phospholipase/acyl hydrolase
LELERLENNFQRTLAKCARPIPGTGGILSLALAVGKSPMECQGLYFKLKDKVFVGKRPYDVVPMEDFLKQEFTEELMMSQLPPKPLIAVTGTLADRY